MRVQCDKASSVSPQCSSLLTPVTPDATEPLSPPPDASGDSAEHARQGNFLYSATRYLGWL